MLDFWNRRCAARNVLAVMFVRQSVKSLVQDDTRKVEEGSHDVMSRIEMLEYCRVSDLLVTTRLGHFSDVSRARGSGIVRDCDIWTGRPG